jgi:O-antigen/teichoic acid export membrane protein
MLERMLPDGKEQAGIYAQGFRILDAVSMFAFLFASLLLPMFSKMIKQKESIHNLTLFSFLLLIVPTIGISFSAYFYRVEIVELLYHQHVHSSSSILGVLMLGFIGVSVTYIFGTLLTASGNLRHLNIVAICGVVLNISLNLILIPKYYALGSAIASLITQWLTALAQIIIAKDLFNFKINLKRILLLIFFVVAVYFIARFSTSLDFNWIYKFFGVLVSTLILAFIFRLINLKILFDLLINGDEK